VRSRDRVRGVRIREAAVKLADFFAGTDPGIALSSADTTVGKLDHLCRVTWPGTLSEPGHWWAITEIDGTMLAAGWAPGRLVDARVAIGHALVQHLQHRIERALAC
jgi:hypothetical protein